MLKQGLVQERIGDLTMNQLPPLNTLPQWSRVNNLDKARYPKPFVKVRVDWSMVMVLMIKHIKMMIMSYVLMILLISTMKYQSYVSLMSNDSDDIYKW